MRFLRIKYPVNLAVCLLLCLTVGTTTAAPRKSRQSEVFGPKDHYRLNPYLFNGFSHKSLLQMNRRGGPYGYSIFHSSTSGIDTVKIIALRVEFQLDSSYLTTGNGLFGIYRNNKGTREDLTEYNYYKNNDYKYDNLPHDSTYFAQHLEFVKKYFWRVSRQKLFIDYRVYPSAGSDGYKSYVVPYKITNYSPGAKKKKESWDEYYYRRTVGLMKFVRDAIVSADKNIESPFKNLTVKSINGQNYYYEVLLDTNGDTLSVKRAAILIFHAGASYLTDGGWDGYFGQDTPSDMIDAFVNPEFFDYFAGTDTTIGLDTAGSHAGVLINENSANQMILDEVMLVSETSNQDSLNWGINGILVNQVARQLGIPDLYSTMSGISGIGAFCIMDFAGYSTGRGFIPPWPSAWVRAFMGWDSPKMLEPGSGNSSGSVKALSARAPDDTTILLVPINDHEYYLIENRQRNLTGNPALFNYDTVENVDAAVDDSIVLRSYDHVNFSLNVATTFDNSRKVIDSVLCTDISIPASGILVWHIDEYIIRDHLEQNIVNADSSYRGISLEEADGVVDLGVEFTDVFYQAVFDYGGAADIFPHFSSKNKNSVDTIGPFTRPSTKSNDGGHTYLSLAIQPSHTADQTEKTLIEDYIVYNFADSSFKISVSYDSGSVSTFSQWPRRIIPDKFFEPVLCNVYPNGDTLEFVVVDTTGRVYVWTGNEKSKLYSPVTEPLPTLLFSFDTVFADTIAYCAKIPQPANMPTCVDSANLYIPSRNGTVYVLRMIDSVQAQWDSISLGHPASSYVCNYSVKKWAVGCSDGVIVFGDDAAATVIPSLSPAAVQALAVVNATQGILASITATGLIQICSPSGVLDSASLPGLPVAGIYPPFTLVTADLDQNGQIDIIASDRKQGLWLFTYDSDAKKLTISPEWIGHPNDWAGSHRLDTSRAAIPDNESAPSIADLDNDNVLDIVCGGTNGVYAYNLRGTLLAEWPGLLDTRFWYQRGSVTSTPVIAYAPQSSDPLVVFSAPTGQYVTIAVAHIDSVNKTTGTIYFTRKDGVRDSASDLSNSAIDSMLVFGDSLVLPYVTPGGFIDAFNAHAKRPSYVNKLDNVGKVIQSKWPFTVGGSIKTSPLLCDIDRNNKTDMFTVTEGGMVYRWEVANAIMPVSYVWPQAGACNARTFSYAGPVSPITYDQGSDIVHFYNYPNPAKRLDKGFPFVTTFKYQLTKPARKVTLDIFTITGYHIVSESGLPHGFGWNEIQISLAKFGSAVYRCRLEADFNGKKKVKYWKMAVIK